MMMGDAWDFNQILQWCNFFWLVDDEYDSEIRIEIASAIHDLAKCFDACLKAHLAAYDLNVARRDRPVSPIFL